VCSRDMASVMFMALRGMCRVSTYVSYLQNTGNSGVHMDQKTFEDYKMGEVVIYPDRVEEFEDLSDEQLDDIRNKLLTYWGYEVPVE
jgi:hypothetical protein